MYHPTTRLLTVLELLQARPSMSGAELSERLEVDGRTVRRYVTMLQDMGIPVEATHGRYGGYHLRPGFKLPPLMFTDDEALAITLGLLAARHLGLASTAPDIEGALAKLERVLPVALGERIRAAEETVGFSQSVRPAAPASGDTLLTLSTAAQRQHRVWLRYRAGDGVESERTVAPYGLVFHQGRWYLVGLDSKSEEVRTFRVDRVLEAEPKEDPFERPRDFDPVDHLMRALAQIPWGHEIEVLLKTTLADARSMVPAHLGLLEETGEGIILRTQVEDFESAARSLAVLSCRFVVIRPPELREALQRVGRELLETADAAPLSGS